MRYGTTFNQIGQAIPAGLHIPRNLANFPYVPHPLQLSGHIPMSGRIGANHQFTRVQPPSRVEKAVRGAGTRKG